MPAPHPPRRRPLPRAARLGALLGAGVIAAVLLSVTGCMERLFYYPARAPTTPPPGLAPVEDVWFRSSDGTKLHGWLIPATDGTPRSEAPTILHVHGNAGNVEGHVWFTAYLPEAGFNVFIFDYRGYGRSDGSARRRGPLIADTDAAVEALLARDDIDHSRLGMYGQSLGGAIGLNVMADRPEIRAAVIESTFTSWREIAAGAAGGGPVSRTLARLLIHDDHRTDEALARIERPILLLHGTADTTVPISHGRRLATGAGPNVQLVELPGGEHNSLRDTHPEIERLTIEFFRRNLAPGGGK